MDPSKPGDDSPTPIRSRISDFKFTDPVRFLLEHIQSKDPKPSSVPKNNNEWVKSSEKSPETSHEPEKSENETELVTAPSLSRKTPKSLAVPNGSSSPVDVADDVPASSSAKGSSADIRFNEASREKDMVNATDEPVVQEPETPIPNADVPEPVEESEEPATIFPPAKLEKIKLAMRHRLRNKLQNSKKSDTSTLNRPLTKPPIPPRENSRQIRRHASNKAPSAQTLTGVRPQQTSGSASQKNGVPENTTSLGTQGQSIPAVQQVDGDPQNKDKERVGTASSEEQDDPQQKLLNLCRKSDWTAVEAHLKHFSKTGLPPNLCDPVSIFIFSHISYVQKF